MGSRAGGTGWEWGLGCRMPRRLPDPQAAQQQAGEEGTRGWGPRDPAKVTQQMEAEGEPRRPRASSAHPRTANGAIFSSYAFF